MTTKRIGKIRGHGSIGDLWDWRCRGVYYNFRGTGWHATWEGGLPTIEWNNSRHRPRIPADDEKTNALQARLDAMETELKGRPVDNVPVEVEFDDAGNIVSWRHLFEIVDECALGEMEIVDLRWRIKGMLDLFVKMGLEEGSISERTIERVNNLSEMMQSDSFIYCYRHTIMASRKARLAKRDSGELEWQAEQEDKKLAQRELDEERKRKLS
jgi:hypothetical protein